MTTLPASGPAGTFWNARSGIVSTTRSAPSAASGPVPARASGPSSRASSWSVSGPRELLRMTGCPAATASFATVPPMRPLPTSPTVVMDAVTPVGRRAFRPGRPAAGASSVPAASAERVQQCLHPWSQVGGGAGGDQVPVHDGGLVHPIDTRIDHVVAYRGHAGCPAAFDDLCGDRHPSGVADKGNRFPRLVERPYQVEHRFGAPQLVRRIAARNDKRVEAVRG